MENKLEDFDILNVRESGELAKKTPKFKGFYKHNVCTEFGNRLGLENDTSLILSGEEYGLFQPNRDYYMSIIRTASTPVVNGDVNTSTEIKCTFTYEHSHGWYGTLDMQDTLYEGLNNLQERYNKFRRNNGFEN